MKKSKKISIIIAVILFSVGVIISMCALCSINFDFSALNTANFVTKTYAVDESFRNIHIEDVECNICLIPSNDDKCRVICIESDKTSHSVSVQNNTLTIERTDNRKWYEHIVVFYWGEVKMDVYLPETEYEELYVKSTSGEIKIPENLTFAKADVSSTSGDIHILSNIKKDASIYAVSGNVYIGEITAENINVQSTSGELTLSSMALNGKLTAKSISGDIKLSNIKCQNIISDTTSGNHTFLSVIAKSNIMVESISGNVDLYQSDAETLNIKTTSGNITGTLLTNKIFDVKTTSGNSKIPPSDFGGKCEIKTTSGNIELAISEQ